MNRGTSVPTPADNRFEVILGIVAIAIMLGAYAAVITVLRLCIHMGWYVS